MRRNGTDRDSRFWEVYLDGERLDRCISADDEEGWALVHEKQEGSSFPVEKVLRGKVEFQSSEAVNYENLSEV